MGRVHQAGNRAGNHDSSEVEDSKKAKLEQERREQQYFLWKIWCQINFWCSLCLFIKLLCWILEDAGVTVPRMAFHRFPAVCRTQEAALKHQQSTQVLDIILPAASGLESQHPRIVKFWKRPLWSSSPALSTALCSPLNHVLKCHIHRIFK